MPGMAFWRALLPVLAAALAGGGCFNSSKDGQDAEHDPETIEEQDRSEDLSAPDEDAAGDPVQDPDADAVPDSEDPAIEDRTETEDAAEAADDVPGDEAPDEVVDADMTDMDEAEEIEDMADGEVFDPYPAPDFTLVDANSASSTYHEIRTLSGARGKVIVLYFVGFS